MDVWLRADARNYSSIALAVQVPEWEADEIRRLADHPQIVQAMVMSNLQAHAFGHPIFDPVHRACAECAVPLAIHSLGDAFAVAAVSPTASGQPSYYAKYHSSACQGIMTRLLGSIVHGVFDRYPDLKLVLTEVASRGYPDSFGAL